MERVRLEARPRAGRGTKEARALRRDHQIPGVIYASGSEPVAISVGARDLRHAVAEGGMHAILEVAVEGDGGTRTAMIKDLQLDPIRDTVLHLDLHEIRLDRPIASSISVHLEGEPAGVTAGGTLSAPVHEVAIQALPGDIPDALHVDVSALQVGESLRLADVPAPQGVTFTDDPESVVLATVTPPTVLEEPEDEEAAEGALEEGEAAAGPEGEPGDAPTPE